MKPILKIKSYEAEFEQKVNSGKLILPNPNTNMTQYDNNNNNVNIISSTNYNTNYNTNYITNPNNNNKHTNFPYQNEYYSSPNITPKTDYSKYFIDSSQQYYYSSTNFPTHYQKSPTQIKYQKITPTQTWRSGEKGNLLVRREQGWKDVCLEDMIKL